MKELLTVNALAAGYIETGLGFQLTEKQKEQIKKQIPIGRFASPREIADVVVFLASLKAS